MLFQLPSLLSSRRRTGAVVVVLVASLCGVGMPAARSQDVRTPAPADLVVGESSSTVAAQRLIVRWKQSATPQARSAARSAAETRPVRALGDEDVQLLRPEAGQTTAEAVATLQDDPRVASAEPDQYLTTFGAPNDPDLPLQWGLSNTGAPIQGFEGAKSGGDANVLPAWDRTVGTPGTVVAVLDTGYDFLNPDLGAVAWTNPGEIAGNGVDDDGNGKVDDTRGWDFVGADLDNPVEDNDPTDDDVQGGGHGLHVAGTIGAKGNDAHGITGVAQNVRLMPLRVCSWSTKSRASTCSLSALIAAINYAGAMGARVANLSLGGPQFSQATVDALAANPGTLYVVAAGNYARDNEEYPIYPCSYNPKADSTIAGRVDNVVCVAASDQADEPASFSNWGRTSVDLAAPGVNIWSLYRSGTVFSDDFTKADFTNRWTPSGLGFGRGASGDGKLTSPGMTDSPGAAPAPGLHEVVSVPVAVPNNVETCRVQGDRWSKAGEGSTFDYSVLVDGQSDPNMVFAPVDSTTGLMRGFITTPFDGALIAGRSISLKFTYQAAAGLDATYGVWLDNLELVCARSAAKPALYNYLSGTSMASPMVTGAAALLFSLKPAAGVGQVRSALLGGAERLVPWKGLTGTGGRLDVAAAMGRLVPPDTGFVSAPEVSGQSVSLRIAQVGSVPSVRFQCRLDAGTFRSCNPNGVLRGVRPGRHVLWTRAVDPYGNVDPTPVSASFTVHGCLVPSMIGSTVSRVMALLPQYGCSKGAVVRPPGVPLRYLRLKATAPGAGTYLPADGAPVKLVWVRR